MIGYTAGLFDLFHVGDLDLLRRARQGCDRLVVGVASDELAEATWGVRPYVPLTERREILANVRYVDDAVAIDDWDVPACDVLFTVEDVSPPGVRVVRLTDLRETASPVLAAALVRDVSRSSVA